MQILIKGRAECRLKRRALYAMVDNFTVSVTRRRKE